MQVPEVPGGSGVGRPRAERDALPQLVLDNVKDVGLERSIGQVIPARVSFLMGNKAVLEMNGRFVLAESQVPMGAGDRLLVRVRSYDGERAVLSLVEQKERPAGAPTMRQDLESMLNRFGLKGTPQEKGLATAMLEHGFGVDEGTLKAMLAASNEGNASPEQLEALMFARAHGIPISEATRDGAEAYLSGMPRLGAQLGEAGKALGALALALEGLGVEAGVAPGVPGPVAPGSGGPPGAPGQPVPAGQPVAPGQQVPAGQPVAPGQQVPTGPQQAVPQGPEQAATPHPLEPDAPRPMPGQGGFPEKGIAGNTNEGPPPLPLAAEAEHGMGSGQTLSPALPKGVSPEVFGLALSLRAAFATGEAGPGFPSARELLDVLKDLQQHLAAFTVGDQTSAETVQRAVTALTSSTENALMRAPGAAPPSVEELFKSDLSPQEIIQHLLHPEKPGEAAAARPGHDLLLDLQRLRDALHHLADDPAFTGRDNPAFRALVENARNVGGLLDTQRMMNASPLQRDERGAHYLAVPFALPGQPSPQPSELRIYPPPRRKPGEQHRLEDLKVTFYLNASRLGRMKIDMSYGSGALHFHFMVGSAEARSYLHERSSSLRKRMEEHDFKIGRLDLEVGEVPQIDRTVARKAEIGQIQKLGKLDLRA